MISIADYQVTQGLHASSTTVVVRARRQTDGASVIIKAPAEEHPARGDLARIRHEYDILKSLSIPQVSSALGLEQSGRSLALVLEDLGGESVEEIAHAQRLSPRDFLRLAIAITRSVQSIHAKQVIHKDLKPSHMFLDPSGVVRIIDFGISTDLAQERCPAINPDALAGTLAYMAPEQTGRMNQPIDRRSDLYALGVSLFELATGELPFRASDPLEIVHCHIARSAPRADLVRPGLPSPVASIIQKLMAKDPEDRYQGADGLRADLELSLARLEETGTIEPFELGGKDQSDTLQIPQRLYGRSEAIATIQASFDAACSGNPQVLLISGSSGIGKSAVVLQLRQRLILHGSLVMGKYDQYGRSEPYSALADACRELVRGVLGAPGETLAAKRRALLETLGANAGLIIDLVPELELVVGRQSIPPPLGPRESQNRFEQAFEDFLRALVTPSEPLAIFLDDLQWADASSLRLVGQVTTSRLPILVIGTYRDSEVHEMHPLVLEISELERKGVPVARLSLAPLSAGDIAELLSDTLGHPASAMGDLATTLLGKTHGNPFHLGQFLQGLERDGLVRPQAGSRRWSFDLPAIGRYRAADNVVEFVLHRLRTLPSDAQRVLGQAACVGDEVDSTTLALVTGLDPGPLAAGLTSALRAGAMIPLDDNYRYLALGDGGLTSRYRFAHDRVRQAAYDLVPDGQKATAHLRIGRLLRPESSDGAEHERLFTAVRQMNRGAAILEDDNERRWLIHANLRCARIAMASAADAAALDHAVQALALLGQDPWPADHDAAMQARMIQAECEYMTGRPKRALLFLDDVDGHAREDTERIASANLRVIALVRLGRFLEATRANAVALQWLGVDVPDPTDSTTVRAAVAEEFAAVQGALENGVGLQGLTEMTDPLAILRLRTLAGCVPSAYHSAPEFMLLVVLKGMRHTIEHGATDLTSFLILQYALAHLVITGDHVAAYRFGRIGLEVGQSRANRAAAGPAHFLFAAFVSHWVDPIAQNLEHFSIGLRRSLEGGDLLHAAFCVGMRVLYKISSGAPLPDIREELPGAIATVERMGDQANREYLEICSRQIAGLSGECAPFGAGLEKSLEDPTFEASLQSTILAALRAAQAWTRFLAGRFAEALEAAEGGVRYPGSPSIRDFAFYGGLSHAALARTGNEAERDRHLQGLGEHHAEFVKWTSQRGTAYGHRRDLLAAELAELQHDGSRAVDLYERAIDSARGLGLLHDDALACELAGEFHLRAGRSRLARLYLADAVRTYRAWGATAKALQLGSRHAGLAVLPDAADPVAESRADREKTRQATSPSSTGTGVALDVESAMRASQAIASELDSGRLLDRLLRILVENAGAQRGVLMAPRGDQLVVEAERTVEPDEVRMWHGAAMEEVGVPERMIRYVARTNETVACGDAAGEPGRFADDPYVAVRQPKSVLCVPLLYEGQLGAVVYLENRDAAHVFNPARVERIRFLAVQAASALANSQLYEEVQASKRKLEERVRDRTIELSHRNSELKGVFDAVAQGLLTIDREGRVVGEISAAALAWLGPIGEGEALETALSRIDPVSAKAFATGFARLATGDEVLPPDAGNLPRRFVTNGRFLDLEFRPVGGEQGWTRMLVVISDTTEEEHRKRLELELRHAQKLEAVGQLAAGIAHEINTPVQYVSDNISFLADGFEQMRGVLELYRRTLAGLVGGPGDPGSSVEIAKAEEEADIAFIEENVPPAFMTARDGLSRIATLVGAMKEFAHPDHREKKPSDLNRALRNTLTIAGNEYKQVAVVEEDLGEIPMVICHLSDINQVFLNLLVNAAHAISDVVGDSGDLGRIRLQTRSEGAWVRIRIEDSGCGIPDEIRDRIFDPFFTTKAVGRGSGQGLAIARSIVVDKHGGRLEFESVPGKGTTFTILLPTDPEGRVSSR